MEVVKRTRNEFEFNMYRNLEKKTPDTKFIVVLLLVLLLFVFVLLEREFFSADVLRIILMLEREESRAALIGADMRTLN